MAKIDVKFNEETGTLEMREVVEQSDANKFILETARQDLENLFEDYLMKVFKIETMQIPKGLSVIVMQYFFQYEPDEKLNEALQLNATKVPE